MEEKEFADGFRGGSALILAVVLTSLLAVIGMMFIMTARVDRMSTSAISENRDLNAAVEAVIAKISHELAMDVPGMPEGREYYDYPGRQDRWLASLEPYNDGGTYRWAQISDVNGYISDSNWATNDIPIDNSAVLGDKEHDKIDVVGGVLQEQLADADGDGVADSKWIELDDMTSSKGETIYAAVRVIDKGGMLNVNTAYMFDPNNTDSNYIDGSDQMQINLLALAERGTGDIGDLETMRSHDAQYLENVVWRYYIPNGNYTPFDISDELELRNRFTLNRSDIDSRIEEVWDSAFQALNYLRTPVDDSTAFASWQKEVYYDYASTEPNDSNDYSYRHIGTIYNMDRIIDPAGDKMLNINAVGNVNSAYRAIKAGLPSGDPNFPNVNETAAQIAVNLVDFRDTDSEVSSIEVNDVNGTPGTYYGFETPCIYISELAHKFKQIIPPGGPAPVVYYRSYAIELYKPYTEDVYPDPNQQWRLNIGTYGTVNVNWSGSKRFHVTLFEDPGDPAVEMSSEVAFDPNDADPNNPSIDGSPQDEAKPTGDIVFDADDEIILERRVDNVNDVWIKVDSVTVPEAVDDWLAYDVNSHSVQRDITLHKCIRRLWDPDESIPVTLGEGNRFAALPDPIFIQAHPENRAFRNVGEIGKLFRADVYRRTWSTFDRERDVRLNLADPNYHGLFQYLTRMDPSRDGINNDSDRTATDPNLTDENALDLTPEWKVPGRINVNTAPWFVIRQLPWMRTEIAQAIAAYRDKLNMDPNGPDYSDRETQTGIDGLREEEGFASIAELATVISESGYGEYSMNYYALSSVGQRGDLLDYPDLTPGDGAEDDFEEYDVIFSRISDLVTVRSDVFSAYILVRIGVDGPQKRAMAILDRSNVYQPGDRVRVIGVQPASDPR
ncbi:MAG: hypothetical protein ACYS18_04875 [Planctomycetota bacterium]|jgi:hypothetical protein